MNYSQYWGEGGGGGVIVEKLSWKFGFPDLQTRTMLHCRNRVGTKVECW